MAKTDDVVTKLLKDHEQVKKLFARVEQAGPAQVANLFRDLTNELVRHEVAEETIVFPVARKVVPNGERVTNARLKEQAAAEELLKEMERETTADPHFSESLAKLQKAVLEHAHKEETLVFEPLRRVLDQARRERLGTEYETAKAVAPTHPHPNAPDSVPANAVVGPIAGLIDRMRDAIHRRAS